MEGGVRQLAREVAGVGDRGVGVEDTVPQVHRRLISASGNGHGGLITASSCITARVPCRSASATASNSIRRPACLAFGVVAIARLRDRSSLAGLASDHLIIVNGTTLSMGAFLASQP
jgi:hypothetical protein